MPRPGKVSAKELREAVDAEREVVGRLTDNARGLMNKRGGDLSESVLERVAQTLHALSADSDLRSVEDATRLSSERQSTGAERSRSRRAGEGGASRRRVSPVRRRQRSCASDFSGPSRRRASSARPAHVRRRRRQLRESALVRAREEMRRADRKVEDTESELEDLRRRLKELE